MAVLAVALDIGIMQQLLEVLQHLDRVMLVVQLLAHLVNALVQVEAEQEPLVETQMLQLVAMVV
jgi:hypothetical protein